MKNKLFRSRWQAAVLLAASLLAPGSLKAMPVVDTVTGGPWYGNSRYYGYVDGNTANEAQFHTPYALAMDTTGGLLYVADRDNDAIRLIDFGAGQTFTFVWDGINQPIGVAVDNSDNVYVLNRGNGTDGEILKFDFYGDPISTLASGLVDAEGFCMDTAGNMYATVQNNRIIQVTPGGVQSTVAVVTNAGASLRGLVRKHNGNLAVCDAGRHGIYLVNPFTGQVTTNAGFHGVGDFVNNGNNVSSSTTAKFNQPHGVVEAGDGTLIVTDYGNHRVKVVLATGVVTNLYGVSANYWVGPLNPSQGIYPGWWDGTVAIPDSVSPVEARQPLGIFFAADGTIYTTEIYYHLIRKVTNTKLPPPLPPAPLAPLIANVVSNFGTVTLNWSTVTGATNYFVKRSQQAGGPYSIIATTSATTYTDTTVINGTTYYYIVTAVNPGGESPGSNEVNSTPPQPPVADPQIGYVDYPPIANLSVFHPVSSAVFNNPVDIVIVGPMGTQIYYTYGNTLDLNEVPTPTESSSVGNAGYANGKTPNGVIPYKVASIQPKLSIKAIGMQTGHPNSGVVGAKFEFIVGNPLIVGNNLAQFGIGSVTDGAELWYTTDGSEPTNAAPSLSAGITTGGTNLLSLSLGFPPNSTNLVFKVRGFKEFFQPSGIVSVLFSATNFTANKISFGFAAGEASSDFIASPGQYFYAPVTLTILPNTKMYSLQFNASVTNGGPNPGPAVAPGAMGFESFLVKPDPAGSGLYLDIPPLSFSGYQADPPPADKLVTYNGGPFVDMTFMNTNDGRNLMGIGWLERIGETNLYNTLEQDLIKYSLPHDTLFLEENGKVVAGGYAFQVPVTAVISNTYVIELGRPSATSDGVGAPGHDVYIAAPTNSTLYGGGVNAIKIVTVGQRKYVVGDAAPFRWFNAGDFGNTNLLNDDVAQIFQSAVYSLNVPPFDWNSFNGVGFDNVSDFYDVMDSCGNIGILDVATGYYTNATKYINGYVQDGGWAGLFDGSDPNINQIMFGDGLLDVCDIYVTFRRSLDPTLCWHKRFWDNGQRVAEPMCEQPVPASLPTAAAIVAFADFSSTDLVVSAGQTVQIPIKANITGNYPLRVLALNLNIVPLDGSSPITSAIQFAPNPALGAPSRTMTKAAGNFAGVWLNKSIAGLTGNATLGTLTVQIPAGANANAAYAIQFEHVSASPNGLGSFPKKTHTGLVTLSNRSGSSWNDGISDSWRLRYFGSINNWLCAASADADGDGANNQHEFQAGTDPNDAASVLRMRAHRESNQSFVIHWPSVAGKQYVVERSLTFNSPIWSAISTNNGTGGEIEFHDSPTGPTTRFYRVRPLN